jgi:hypothetical protein
MTTQVSGTVSALPRSGVGLSADSSISFLMVSSLVTLLYLAVALLIRRASGHTPEVEDDGIIVS